MRVKAPYDDPGAGESAWIRLRMNAVDGHYGGGLVDGSRMLQIFGDLATELAVRTEQNEGLLRAYELVEFLAPVFSGDFIEAKAHIVSVGKSSRRISFQAHKHITHEASADGSVPTVLAEPQLVARAMGTVVIPRNAPAIQSKPAKQQ